MTRCTSKCPDESLPAGMTLDVARTHPRYKHLLERIQCELQAGHEGVHRRGAHLSWHDPQRLIVGGRER